MRTYLIVGGSTGIGRSLVDLLISSGHRVVALSRDARGIDQLDGVTHIPWDITQEGFPALEVDMLDGAVYCPGSINLKPFHRLTDEEIRTEFELNALGAARTLRNVMPLLKKGQSPAVVLYSTVAVQTGMPFHASIAMAKGAIEGLTRSLAAEWAPAIRVNAIAPSLTQTPLAEKLTGTPEKIEAGNKRHPLARIGQPEDLASMTNFLLDPNASWITGQIFHVDGGMGSLKI